MSPNTEGAVALKWHNAADLTTPGGAAEAEARIRTYAKMGGTTISIEADEAGQFLSTAERQPPSAVLDEVDPGWAEAAPFHVETDPSHSNTPPPPLASARHGDASGLCRTGPP
jgi:hypothetical protein